jgi:hypothetical protein
VAAGTVGVAAGTGAVVRWFGRVGESVGIGWLGWNDRTTLQQIWKATDVLARGRCGLV